MKMIAYCGLYCRLCAEQARIPKLARSLQGAMKAEGWPNWGESVPGFSEFWGFLDRPTDGGCPGCRSGGGPPNCRIRTCAQERGVNACPECPDYPCDKIRLLGEVYPTLLADGLRMQEVGIDRWVTEQEERARRGVVYADIRCPAEGVEELFGQ